MVAASLYQRFTTMPSIARFRILFDKVGDLSLPQNRALDRQRRAMLSALMSMFAKVISASTALLTVPLTLHYLGPERYGMWMIMSSLVAMLSFADLGIGNGILNTVAAAYGRGDQSAIRLAVSSGFVALGSVAIIIILGLWMCYPYVGWHRFFNVRSPLARSESGPAITAFVLCFALSVPATIVQRVQLGMQRGFLTSVWMCVGSALTLPAILVAIRLHAGLPALVTVLVGAPLLTNTLNSFVFFAWQAPGLRPKASLATRAQIAEAVRHGSYFVLIQLGNSVTAGCVPIIIAHVIGPEAVALYTVPERLLALVVMLVSMYVQPLWPAYREALVRGDLDWVSRTYKHTLLAVLGTATLMLSILGLALPILLRIWVNSAVHPPTLLIVGLCIYKTLESLLWVNAMFLNGMNVLAPQSVMAVSNALVFTLLGTIGCLHFGVAIMPWSGAVALAICSLAPGFWIAHRLIARN